MKCVYCSISTWLLVCLFRDFLFISMNQFKVLKNTRRCQCITSLLRCSAVNIIWFSKLKSYVHSFICRSSKKKRKQSSFTFDCWSFTVKVICDPSCVTKCYSSFVQLNAIDLVHVPSKPNYQKRNMLELIVSKVDVIFFRTY